MVVAFGGGAGTSPSVPVAKRRYSPMKRYQPDERPTSHVLEEIEQHLDSFNKTVNRLLPKYMPVIDAKDNDHSGSDFTLTRNRRRVRS